MIGKVILLLALFCAPAFALLDCNSTGPQLLAKSLGASLVNLNSSFEPYSFYNVTSYSCFNGTFNGTLVAKTRQSDPYGVGLSFVYNDSGTFFSKPYDYYSLNYFFNENESSVLGSVLMKRIVDFEQGNSSDTPFWIVFNITQCSPASENLFNKSLGSFVYLDSPHGCYYFLKTRPSLLRNESKNFFFKASYYSDSLFFRYDAVADLSENVADFSSVLKSCNAPACVSHFRSKDAYVLSSFVNFSDYNVNITASSLDGVNWSLKVILSSENSSPILHIIDASNEVNAFLSKYLNTQSSLNFGSSYFNSSMPLESDTNVFGASINWNAFSNFTVLKNSYLNTYSLNSTKLRVFNQYLWILKNNTFMRFYGNSVRVTKFFPFVNKTVAGSEISSEVSYVVSVPETLWSFNITPSPNDTVIVPSVPPAVFADNSKQVSYPYSPFVVLVGILLTASLVIHYTPKRKA